MKILSPKVKQTAAMQAVKELRPHRIPRCLM
nr:MAG TPA: hypothetical protein [Caudoviricetes sp.]